MKIMSNSHEKTMQKQFTIFIFSIPVIAIILIMIANYDNSYLACLIEYQSREDTSDYCTYFHFRWQGYEYLP